VIAAVDVPAASAQGAATVMVNAGSGIAADAAVVVPGSKLEAGMGLTQLNAGLNVVGGAGLNAALRDNVDSFNREGLGGLSGRAGLTR
jgi:hypothetical protein